MPKVWITRDKRENTVELWTVKPNYNPDAEEYRPRVWTANTLPITLCWENWKRLTHPKLHIKKGELKELDGIFTVTKPRGGK